VCGQFLHRVEEECHPLTGHSNFELVRHDVTFPLYIEVDQIFNLAARHRRFIISTTGTDHEDQRACAINMLGLAKRLRATIFQASTSEVYVTRTCIRRWRLLGHVNPIGPRSCYDEGKRCRDFVLRLPSAARAEHQVARFSIPTVRACTRMMGGWSPRSSCRRCGRVDHHFRRRSQTRSFCYVSDLIDAFMRYMDLPMTFQGGEPRQSHEFTIGSWPKR